MSKQVTFSSSENFDDGDHVRQDQTGLDELISKISIYRNSREYLKLLQFISKFRHYSPYNCFLLHMQNPQIGYVASAKDWRKRFNRSVKLGSRALVILKPMGPVHFLYDLSDTTGDDSRLPTEVTNPFQTLGKFDACIWDNTLRFCREDGILVIEEPNSLIQAGSVTRSEFNDVSKDGLPPLLYEVRLNSELDLPTRYTTLVHELGHLFAGHLGSDKNHQWDDRRGLDKASREFEAESIAYLVCRRAGLNSQSEKYLANYVEQHECIPDINFHIILDVARDIEKIGQNNFKRKQSKPQD
jgi:hypothetical protein